ncbi:poly-gamma-glutamate synthase PgsB [Maribius pontilimi]|uniref:Poly-gamma-glutamate synthase PgsB n=1 Tax=Palleronia pontilimi TaxID=1964209 RepID=A0A934MED1_9RHOB|nr:poly-gamma-glutamate synthase PgsB [Palleronia pontilimi]MBJ3763336.1 poly-gamma-glutamate synthase PgsB [Palleronia pontilimi]
MSDTFQNWGPLALATLAAASVIVFWILQTARHERLLARLPIRVHVNGIRGKSTIVRYIAGALREGGITTVAKTTGSATRLIHPDGSEEPIRRIGAPTIIEQIEILGRATGPDTQAIVIECMALDTEYQRISEQRMIRATDGIIANVRRDHVEQMGYELPDIARALSNTAPLNAPLLTAERDPELRAILSQAARARGGQLVAVRGADVSDAELDGFGPLTFPENVALALAVAERHGVDRATALRGMRGARMDPGASGVFHHAIDGRDLWWINLFGVNDVDSARINLRRVMGWAERRGDVALVLNNRADRENRTLQFAEMLSEMGAATRVFLSGEGLDKLQDALRHAGLDDASRLDLPKDLSPRAVLHSVSDKGSVVLIGLANIHTRDADLIRAVLEDPAAAWSGDRDTDVAQAPCTDRDAA